ncbi:MAG: hypothetical protein JOZ02_23600 [Acidobacteria bacterium]|nr:hypothetical protein [Acidobacteriota bacterium]
MSAKLRRHSERGVRVDLFMTANAEDFPEGSKAATAHTRLKEELAGLDTLKEARATGVGKRQEGTAGRRETRKRLRELVNAVSNTAQTIALDRQDFKGMFSLKELDDSDDTLIATARAFAERAAAFVGLFVEYNLKQTLVTDLRSDADSLASFKVLQEEGIGEHSGSNTSADEAVRRLTEQVERLDTFVRNKYRGDPARIAAWERARRLEKAPQHPKDDGNAPPTPPNQ